MKMELTKLEIEVLTDIFKGNMNGEAIDEFSNYCEYLAMFDIRLREPQLRGVLSSLIKKEYILIYKDGRDSVLKILDKALDWNKSRMLYKNVDMCDLNRILSEGILPIDLTKNNNWDERRRANNATDLVYLFSPKGTQNSFPKYGIVLLEIDADAIENKMSEYDSHINDYNEYVIDKVEAHQIINIYIPAIFKNRLSHYSSEDFFNKIIWVEIEAMYYAEDNNTGEYELKKADEDILKLFAETAEIESSIFNFFRGTMENGHVLDLYNVKYII